MSNETTPQGDRSSWSDPACQHDCQEAKTGEDHDCAHCDCCRDGQAIMDAEDDERVANAFSERDAIAKRVKELQMEIDEVRHRSLINDSPCTDDYQKEIVCAKCKGTILIGDGGYVTEGDKYYHSHACWGYVQEDRVKECANRISSLEKQLSEEVSARQELLREVEAFRSCSTVIGTCGECGSAMESLTCSACVNLLISERTSLRAEVDQAMTLLEPGRVFRVDNSEKPTTLVERARYVVMALGAEADGNDEARKELRDIRTEMKQLKERIEKRISRCDDGCVCGLHDLLTQEG